MSSKRERGCAYNHVYKKKKTERLRDQALIILTCKDGITLNQTVKSTIIAEMLEKNGWEMPSSQTLKKIILKAKDQEIQRVKKLISVELSHNTNFL